MYLKHILACILSFFFLSVSFSQFSNEGYAPGQYPIDTACFEKICSPKNVPQYYQLAAKNQKSSYQILNEWLAVFKKPTNFTQSGFLTIRFIINCKGEPCCFHIYEMDDKYQKITFDEDVKKQLRSFVEKLGGWKPAEYEGKPMNYYYYLNFNIKNGNFQSVSP